MTTRPFMLRVNVSGDFFRHDAPMARALAREMLVDQSHNLKGPRGGRYVRINQPQDFRESGDDPYLRDEWVFTARVVGQYVRPSR